MTAFNQEVDKFFTLVEQGKVRFAFFDSVLVHILVLLYRNISK